MPKNPNESLDCHICDKIFNNWDARTRHMKKEHNHLKPCLKCPGMLQRCFLSNCRRINGHCHDPLHDEECPGPAVNNFSSAPQSSRLPPAQNPEVGPCAVCPSRPRCVARGCRARNHCHNCEHRSGQAMIAVRRAFLLDSWDARAYAQLIAAQPLQRQQPAIAGPHAWNYAQQPDAGTRAPDGDWQIEHMATVEGLCAHHRQELDFALGRADERGRLDPRQLNDVA